MLHTIARKWESLLILLVLVLSASPALAQTSQFTYQGKLTDTGNPANANYDFEIKLFDALSGGTQQGSTIMLLNVPVANGIFTVQLDFTAAFFPGADRFLEISVRPAGGGSFTVLSPRQQISSTPYAIKSTGAASADNLSVTCVNCVTDSQINGLSGSKISGTIPVASVPAGSSSYIQNSTSPQTSSNFNISGTGTANILNATTQYNVGGSRVLGTPGSDNLFVGTGAGAANATGTLNSFFGANAGLNNTSGSSNAFFGRNAGASNLGGGGNAFFGSGAGESNQGGALNSFVGVNAGAVNTIGNNNSFVGAGAGDANIDGSFNSFFGTNAGSVSSSGANNSFIGNLSGSGNTIGSGNTFVGNSAGSLNTTGGNNTIIGTAANVASNNLSFATAIGAGATVSTSNTAVLGRGADTVQVPGNFTVTGTLSGSGASLTSLNAGNISSGTLAVARGGTGLSAAGASGNYLRSNGANWTSSTIQAGDVPSGSTSYIQNTTSPQGSSNFNISGDGIIGGNLTVTGTLTATIPRRKYYMTESTPAGNAVLTACVAGYHMASLAEIFNTSVLEYATAADVGAGVVHTLPDSGSGPPFSSLAFIRVGVSGTNNAVPGNANCISGGNPWSTNSAAVNGTAIALKPTWTDAPTNVSPWDATVRPCINNVAPIAHVWCVQN